MPGWSHRLGLVVMWPWLGVGTLAACRFHTDYDNTEYLCSDDGDGVDRYDQP